MLRTTVIALVLALVTGGQAYGAKKKNASETLFKRLGGKKAITAVVDDFVGRCAKDNRINSFFAATAADAGRLKGFKNNLVDQICEASGGPCKYRGKDMKTAHAGMGVKGEHFDALVENLVASLDKFKVKAKDKKVLLGVLGPMRGDIVEEANRETASEQH